MSSVTCGVDVDAAGNPQRHVNALQSVWSSLVFNPFQVRISRSLLSSRFFSIGFVEQDSVTSVITPNDTNLNWYFQLTFSATSTTIISGAMAERLYLSGCAGIARVRNRRSWSHYPDEISSPNEWQEGFSI